MKSTRADLLQRLSIRPEDPNTPENLNNLAPDYETLKRYHVECIRDRNYLALLGILPWKHQNLPPYILLRLIDALWSTFLTEATQIAVEAAKDENLYNLN